MSAKTKKAIASILLLTTFLGGCKGTQEYQKLSDAGAQYTVAMDDLLTAAGQVQLDTTSEYLLQYHKGTLGRYNQLKKLDEERLAVFEQLRQHNHLLQEYFLKLGELSTSDAPAQTQTEIDAIATNLNQVGDQLRGSNLVPNNVVGLAGKIIVDGRIRGALRHELEQRQDLVRREFVTQRVLLKALGNSMHRELTDTKTLREQRLIIFPFIQGKITSDQQWIAERRAIFQMDTIASEFDQAQTAADAFSQSFDDFIAGKSNKERINTLLADINTFLSFAEQLKHQ